jgi:hypothetical protein
MIIEKGFKYKQFAQIALHRVLLSINLYYGCSKCTKHMFWYLIKGLDVIKTKTVI